MDNQSKQIISQNRKDVENLKINNDIDKNLENKKKYKT